MSGELPLTGFGIVILGMSFGLSWFVGIAAALIVAGVILYRVATRGQRKSSHA